MEGAVSNTSVDGPTADKQGIDLEQMREVLEWALKEHIQGESTVTTFEVSADAPHLFALSPYKPSGLHQGFSFLSKNVCNVRDVEFARAYRLCNNAIEPITFTVPRVKTAYFQDDLFPPTKVLWEPTISSKDWLSGSRR